MSGLILPLSSTFGVQPFNATFIEANQDGVDQTTYDFASADFGSQRYTLLCLVHRADTDVSAI